MAPVRLRIPSRGCGFFGDLFMTLNGLRFAELCRADALVEWGSNSLYFDASGGKNAYCYFFEQAEFDIRQARSRRSLNVKYRPTADTFHRYDGLSVRASVGKAFAKYCIVRREIAEDVEKFIGNKFNDRMLGVHIRMTDAAAGMENRKIATLDLYKLHVDKWIKGNPDGSVFLATDDERVVEEFGSRYGQRLLVRQGMRSKDGTSLHGHYDAGVPGNRIQKGIDVLMDALILARCDFLIRSHSRVTCYTLCINPGLDFTDLSLEIDGVDRTPWLRG